MSIMNRLRALEEVKEFLVVEVKVAANLSEGRKTRKVSSARKAAQKALALVDYNFSGGAARAKNSPLHNTARRRRLSSSGLQCAASFFFV